MQLYVTYKNYRGTNDLTVAHVVKGYCILKTFTSKYRDEAIKRANRYIKTN